MLDLLGRGIPGVEILAYPLGGAESPAAVLRTDALGRFTLQGLRPGSYVLALNKPGYRIHLAQANTAVLSLLTIRLAPIPGRGLQPPEGETGRMDWVLQLPRSDLLKEEDSRGDSPPDPETDGGAPKSAPGPAAPPAASRLPIKGDVSQWYTSTLAILGAGAGEPESTGRSTALQVGGDLLGRGDWEFEGVTRSLTTAAGVPAQGESERDQGANRLRVAMNYRLSPADSLQVRAHFDREHFRPGGLALPAAQDVRTLGYQANFTRSTGDDGGWKIGTDLLHAQAHVPGAPGDALRAGEESSLTDWRMSAGGGYQASLPRDHRISVAARTRFYRYQTRDEGWSVAPIQTGLSLVETGNSGWSLFLSGEDAWKVADPVSLILGLDTHVSEGPGTSVLLVPRVGARREDAASMLQAWILVRSDGAGGPEGGSDAGIGSGSALGYHAEIQRRFEGEWIVRGHVERNPVGFGDRSGFGAATATELPATLLADPDSWSQEVGFFISKRLRDIEGSLESDGGEVVGRVAGIRTDAPVQILEEGRARYLALRATANLVKTETRVHLEYMKIDELDDSAGSGASSQVDLVIFQPIPFVSDRGAGAWRLLFAYQGLSRDLPEGPSSEPAGAPEKVHRFSGGVGVSF